MTNSTTSTTLKFLAKLPTYETEKPYTLYGFPDEIGPKTNCVYSSIGAIPIEDVRGKTKKFRLDDHGFEFHKRPSACELSAQIFEEPANYLQVFKYLEETYKMAQSLLGASKVLCFDWRLRRTGSSCGVEKQLFDLDLARHRAVSVAALMHCDYSHDGGLQTMQIHCSNDEMQGLRNGKYKAKIVNVWRPLRAVEHTPLIMCDRRTVSTEDIQEVDQVTPNKIELSLALQFNKEQKFYWLSRQTPDEITLFTSWDSTPSSGTGCYTPHGAALGMKALDVETPRESVEVRLIVLWNTACS